MFLVLLAALGTLAPAAAAQVGARADVDVQLRQFGVGNAFRPCEVTAIRVSLESALDEATLCWVQWEVPNAEGDVAEYGRSVTLSPATPALVWLYAPLPADASRSTIWRVRVFEERDGRRRRELGGTRISPADVNANAGFNDAAAALAPGMIAVVGRARMGLDGYVNPLPQRRPNPPGAHEDTRIVSGILARELPDRWEGLKPFEAVVWSDAFPEQLREDSANALREYVRRGGHLVIALPEAGNPWMLGARGLTPLERLLVQQAPRTDEGVALSELMPLLSKQDRPLRDFELSIRVFKELDGDFDAIDNGFEPLMALPDGRVVVIQRVFGLGRITMIGIDLTSGRISGQWLPQADVFWNRVLGRRCDTPQPLELKQMDDADPRLLARGVANELTIGDSRLLKYWIDKGGSAEVGLLAAVFLFIAYWALAGPPGFYLLKQRGYVRHAWLAFAVTAALFTAVAWGGVRILREHSTELRHVTFLDHVARPPQPGAVDVPQFQRGILWGSLYLPSYGNVRVSIDSDALQRDLLLTWSAPEKLPEPFPNVDRYAIDVGRAPADYEIPVRATATQLYAHWLGGLDPEWGGMLRVDLDDPIRIERNALGEPYLAGSIVHDLPGPLWGVRVIWVSNARSPRTPYARIRDEEKPWTISPGQHGRPMLNAGHMWIRREDGGPWHPQERFTMPRPDAAGPRGTRLDTNIYTEYIEDEEGDGFDFTGAGRAAARLTPQRARDFMEMLSIFHQLTPPKYYRDGDKEPETAVMDRKLGRELDLSAWFTRPCLIVIGYLDEEQTPVPLLVNGRRPASQGLTVVRWIYPLPLDEAQLVRAPDGSR
jgi:hypothetical protein